jgi:hypothetical protein
MVCMSSNLQHLFWCDLYYHRHFMRGFVWILYIWVIHPNKSIIRCIGSKLLVFYYILCVHLFIRLSVREEHFE